VISVVNGTAVTFCLEMLGFPGVAATPGKIPTALTAVVALSATVWMAQRIAAGVRNLRAHSGEHARAARIVGTPTDRSDVVVVTAERPAAYCVAGRPHAIVITSGAVRSLDHRQLAAVLAHEDAHLRGRHHQTLMVLRAMATALPRLPLFPAAASAISRLLEMCADDVAARRCGTTPLVEGLMRLACGSTAPAVAHLGAADTAVAVRVIRLARRAGLAQRWRHRVALVVTIAVTCVAPAGVALLCVH